MGDMTDMAEFLATLQLGGAMVYPLIGLGFLAILLILEKGFVLARRTRLPSTLAALAETFAVAWGDFDRRVAVLGRRNYFAGFSAPSSTIVRGRPGGSNRVPPTRRA